ncbi:hypothetical protein ABZ646_27085 [Streptomyces sp. NPDC007162]|uniref:hypothetical protein n=1 Tax=Streptomyces sp. NPDC007162 TaxID=3156917 RepID=UPI0033E8998F
MPLLNLADQVQQLRALALDFEALHTRVRDLSYTPGTDDCARSARSCSRPRT